MSYETKFQQKGERGPAERVSFQRDKIRSDPLADIEKPTNRWSEIPPAIEYILDFYCPELKLGIELDGQGHYTIEGSLRDGRRDNRLSARGITVLRIENRAIFENQPAVIELLKETVRRLKASGQSV